MGPLVKGTWVQSKYIQKYSSLDIQKQVNFDYRLFFVSTQLEACILVSDHWNGLRHGQISDLDIKRRHDPRIWTNWTV